MEAVDRNFKKILVFLIALITVSAITILLFILIPSLKGAHKTTLLSVNMAPGDAMLTINGSDYHSGVYEFDAGTYHGTIHKDGFSAKDITFELKANETTTIYEYILSDEEGFSYFEKSQTDIDTLGNIDDEKVKNFLTTYNKKLDIIKSLPILLNYYDSGSASLVSGEVTDGTKDPRCDRAFCLKVDKNKNYEWRVKEVVELAGYKYDNYKVLYED
ncbi:MAG: hypothetical protein Q4D22_00395 [Candidatus Saccharibacteria bacterium]|nr:hypothetical protein [Candidatus Saccharibacteria bacterium]